MNREQDINAGIDAYLRSALNQAYVLLREQGRAGTLAEAAEHVDGRLWRMHGDFPFTEKSGTLGSHGQPHRGEEHAAAVYRLARRIDGMLS